MKTANLLLRDAILGASDIRTEEVHVPEWGGTVLVRGLTAKQRDKAEAAMLQLRGSVTSKTGPDMRLNISGVRALMAAMAIVDGQGNRLFSDADAELLGEKSGAALDRVFAVVTRLSEFSDGDIEELVGNSDADPSGDSNSD